MRGEHVKLVEELNNSTVTLNELYPEGIEETELLSSFVNQSQDPVGLMNTSLKVETMSSEELKNLESGFSNERVIDAFNKNATSEQVEIVKDKIKNFDHDRIIVLDGVTVYDGNHHVIAAIKTNNEVKYVDLP